MLEEVVVALFYTLSRSEEEDEEPQSL
jgi:hypothetical protein